MHTVTITNGIEKTTIHSDNLDRISGGKIVKAVNAVDSFTFTIYPDNAGYDKLKPLTTSVTVTDDSTGNFNSHAHVERDWKQRLSVMLTTKAYF